MGLAKIRDGDLDDGTREIETAASLDPNNSLVRSYLGKAYYEQKRDGLASSEYEQAKLLDPKDPTPWFYDAIHKQTTNRPVEALYDLQTAIDLNDNRAVYRSRLLLDEDLAARSAALGRIYNDLGFQQLGLVEGWKSVNSGPSNYSAHRLLADNYAALPRHEVARVSELLQSQLLQPINITPVQPNLAESNLLLLEGSGPSDPSFNEFNPLFTRNRFALQASGVLGTNDTYGDEVTQSGVWNKFSYSLGQFHSETDGFRKNNDLEHDIYNLFAQASFSPKFSVQAEFRHKELDHGDLALSPDEDEFNRNFRRKLRTDTVRVGAHYRSTPQSTFVVSAIRQDSDQEQEFGFANFTDDGSGYLAETQYLFDSSTINIIIGGGYSTTSTDFSIATPFFSDQGETEMTQGTAYSYSNFRYPHRLKWTIGVSLDSFDDTERDFNLVNPKFGVMWDVTEDTLLRVAAFRVQKRSLLTNQTIEPTQVAGFNQLFDDPTGTDSKRYGVALDQEFSSNLHGGIEASKRDLDVPSGDRIEDWSEELYGAYLNWTPGERLAVNIAYQFERFDIDLPIANFPKTDTHRLPVSLTYFSPSGFFSRWGITYINQFVDGDDLGKDNNGFALLDASIGYRLPKRYGIIRLEAKNLFDEDVKFQGFDDRTNRVEEDTLFVLDRAIVALFTLAF